MKILQAAAASPEQIQLRNGHHHRGHHHSPTPSLKGGKPSFCYKRPASPHLLFPFFRNLLSLLISLSHQPLICFFFLFFLQFAAFSLPLASNKR